MDFILRSNKKKQMLFVDINVDIVEMSLFFVGVDINVTDAEICIALKPTVLKLSQSDVS